MAEHLSEQEHRNLSEALESGRASLMFTRTFARQFYLRVGAQSISEKTGKNALGHKILIYGMLATSLLLLAASLVLVVQAFGWAGLFVVALLGVFWTILAGFTTELGNLVHSLVMLAVALVVAYFLPSGYGPPTICFVLSVFFFRSAHLLAFHFLYRLISQSWDAYNQLHEHIIVEQN